MTAAIFAECPDQSGMHFNGQEYVFVEVVDPETGNVLPLETGVAGELVYTSLDRECVPLLRFRTRDRVTIQGTSCVCGRTSFKLRCVGRTDDMLIVLGVNVFPSAVKDVVSSFYPRLTGEMQILLEHPGPGVKPPLRVVAEYGRDAANLADLKIEVEGKIKAVLSVPASVELVLPGTLPKFEMKAQLVKKLYPGDSEPEGIQTTPGVVASRGSASARVIHLAYSRSGQDRTILMQKSAYYS